MTARKVVLELQGGTTVGVPTRHVTLSPSGGLVASSPVRYVTVSSTVTGPQGPPGPPAVATFGVPGFLTTGTGQGKFIFYDTRQILGVYTAVTDDPDGQAILVDLNINGFTIFTTQANRPRINPGTYISPIATPDLPLVTAGDAMTVDIDQVGVGNPGSDLTVQVIYQ